MTAEGSNPTETADRECTLTKSVSGPSPPPRLFYPQGTPTPEILMHLKHKFLAASSPEGWSLLGGNVMIVPPVRPAKQISKSSSIFTPAQVHFPIHTSPLCL